MSAGLLSEVFKKFSALGITTAPQIVQDTVVIELKQDELKNAVLTGVDEKVKNAINFELHEGKLIIKIKIF